MSLYRNVAFIGYFINFVFVLTDLLLVIQLTYLSMQTREDTMQGVCYSYLFYYTCWTISVCVRACVRACVCVHIRVCGRV